MGADLASDNVKLCKTQISATLSKIRWRETSLEFACAGFFSRFVSISNLMAFLLSATNNILEAK